MSNQATKRPNNNSDQTVGPMWSWDISILQRETHIINECQYELEFENILTQLMKTKIYNKYIYIIWAM
jgi:hypothetical protein